MIAEPSEPLETRFNYEKFYDERGRAERCYRIRTQFLSVDPKKLDAKRRLAWAIDFYNYLVIEEITDHLLMPGKRQRWTSVQDVKLDGEDLFKHPLVRIDTTTYSLEEFEHHFVFADYDRPDSVSRRIHRANGLPCLNGGGNVGTAAWVVTHALLEKRRIGLLGMDFSYPPGTPLTGTQYYPELRELLGERFAEGYISLPNPFLGETWFTDPAYYWFRDVFLEMAQDAECETVNCTEGGIRHGERVPMVALDEFLAKVARP